LYPEARVPAEPVAAGPGHCRDAPVRCQRAVLAARRGFRQNVAFRLRARAKRPACRPTRQPEPAAIVAAAAGVGMQVSVETVGNLGRRMTFSLPADRLQDQVGGRLREIARTARIKGFRPGKVPAKVIEQRFGQQVRSEVLDGLLREGFDSAVRENELRIAGQPDIAPSEGDELSYVATF